MLDLILKATSSIIMIHESSSMCLKYWCFCRMTMPRYWILKRPMNKIHTCVKVKPIINNYKRETKSELMIDWYIDWYLDVGFASFTESKTRKEALAWNIVLDWYLWFLADCLLLLVAKLQREMTSSKREREYFKLSQSVKDLIPRKWTQKYLFETVIWTKW